MLLMRRVLTKPQKGKLFWQQLLFEIDQLGVDSLGIVAFISLFMGAVVAIQTAYNIDNPFIPMSMVGWTTRQSIILEFSPTVMSLILAGKVGSSIASEISMPIIFFGCRYFAIIIATSAVPVATSKIICGFAETNSLMARFLQ